MRSPQPPGQRQREVEGLGLLTVQAPELQPRARRVAVNLRAGASQFALVAAADRHEATEPHLAVTGCQLRLPPRCRLLSLALSRRLGLAEAPAQLAVGPVARDGRLDVTRRTLRRDRLEG